MTFSIHGMLGIGDNLFQRAVIRDRMKTDRVLLGSWYSAMYHDLIDRGLQVGQFKGTLQRIREDTPLYNADAPRTSDLRLTYSAEAIRRQGSILGAMYAAAHLPIPAAPDFSMPVPKAWRERIRKRLGALDKPLMVYRPIVLNQVWHAPLRSPDPDSYAALFRSIRDRFYVVSIADLTQQEWFVGEQGDVDLKFHKGELSFEALAGLFAEASLVFASPGFAPVMAHAVGAPVAIVYGGNECFATTNSVGAHLSPTLAIEPAPPCSCHVGRGDCGRKCDKRIDLDAALPRLDEFVHTALSRGGVESRTRGVHREPPQSGEGSRSTDAGVAPGPRVLIFGTCYVDSEHRKQCVDRWARLHHKLNPSCDLLLIDSASPLYWHGDGSSIADAQPKGVRIESFPDNIGHLSRGGADGWGRAFCRGLQVAIDEGYDYVVHIEGDSLCRLKVDEVIADMRAREIAVATTPVKGTTRLEIGWVETGLMFMSVAYLKESGFIEKYDWPRRTKHPTPEAVIYKMLGSRLQMMPWKAERGDKSQVTPENVGSLDWVTHCWDREDVYEAFISYIDGARSVKLNFGCGTNKLDGWQNFDDEIDITKRLPFGDATADLILAEHVVEHVDYYAALRFFAECLRVLKPGGVLRIAVPSIEWVWKRGTPEYYQFARKWAPSADARGAMHAMLYAHGHKTAWTDTLLEASLFYAGFDHVHPQRPGLSTHHANLRGVEGHGRVISDAFNDIETIVYEATR